MEEYHLITHKGRFLFCPIYIAEIDSESPVFLPRHNFLGWWLDFNVWLDINVGWILSFFNIEDSGFIINNLVELEEPIKIKKII